MNKPLELIWARFETPHFTVEAFAETKNGALDLLRQRWAIHARQALEHGAPNDVITYFEKYIDDVQIWTVRAGTVIFDNVEGMPNA